MGLLRLATTNAIMGDDCLTIKYAWAAYERFLADPRIEFAREPSEVDHLFRRATSRFSSQSTPKALGDCYLLALSEALNTTLVTMDSGLSDLGSRRGHDVVLVR